MDQCKSWSSPSESGPAETSVSVIVHTHLLIYNNKIYPDLYILVTWFQHLAIIMKLCTMHMVLTWTFLWPFARSHKNSRCTMNGGHFVDTITHSIFQIFQYWHSIMTSSPSHYLSRTVSRRGSDHYDNFCIQTCVSDHYGHLGISRQLAMQQLARMM